MEDERGARTFHDTYILQVTGFRLWSVLELPSEPGRHGVEGCVIYHVTHLRTCDSVGASEAGESLVDRYYATVALLDPHGKPCGRNRLARGGVLELAECLVGGTSNGVETGNVRRSNAPILNYRFEYSPGGMKFHEPPAKAS